MSVQRRIRWAVKHGALRALLQAKARRGHLDARLIIDPAVREDPYPHLDGLREQGVLVRGALGLSTARHEVCTAVLRGKDFGVGTDPELLPKPVRLGLAIGDRNGPVTPFEAPSLISVNPPEHTRYRKLVVRAFTARAIAALREHTEQVADELLDRMAGEPTADLVEQYAGLLPFTIIAEVLGIPVHMREQFLRWGRDATLALDFGLRYPDFKRAEISMAAVGEWMTGHFTTLRREPNDTILSKLVNMSDEDGRLTEHELLVTAMLLLGAGFETTVNLLGSGTSLLLHHPDQLDMLRADPTRWANAVDEILRFETPVQANGRYAVRDTEVHGVPLPRGTGLLLMLAGANRDPAVFEEPERFDVRRANAREHLAFSSGIHHCLGAALARMEGEIGLRRLFERFPDLALAGTPRRRDNAVLRGYASLPVALNSRATTVA